MKIKLIATIALIFTIAPFQAQEIQFTGGHTCAEATPLCTDENYTWLLNTSGTNAETGPDYGCIASEPSPTWFYFKIDSSGDIVLNLETSFDVDFVLWGPFSEPECAYFELSTDNLIDCSYNSGNIETIEIGLNSEYGSTSSIEDEYYVLIITNYNTTNESFTLTQSNFGEPNAGSIDCNHLCFNDFNITHEIDNCNDSSLDSNYFTTFDLHFDLGNVNAYEMDSILVYKEDSLITILYAPIINYYEFDINQLASNGNLSTYNFNIYKSSVLLCTYQTEVQAPLPITIYTIDANQDELGSVVIEMPTYEGYNNVIAFQDTLIFTEQGQYIIENLDTGTYYIYVNSSFTQHTCLIPVEGLNISYMLANSNHKTALNQSNNHFIIYPNPAKDFITIKNLKPNTLTIEILDITGKSLKHIEVKDTSVKVDVSYLDNGVYFINTDNSIQKLIIM